MKINSLLENVTPSSTPVGNNPSSAPKFGRDPKVLEDDKIEETTAGSIASVSQPIGSIQKRGPGALFKGIKTSKKFPNSEAVKEEEIKEQDLIINPILRKGPKAGFHKKDYLRQDHEVEMARSDLVSANKNAKKIYELIKDLSEEDGLEGWVQEKIIKANDYLNSAREYLENKELEQKKSVMDEGGFDIPEIPRAPTPKPSNNKGVEGGRFKQTPGQRQYGALHSQLRSLANSGQINTPDGKQKAEKMIDTIQQLVDTDPSCAGSTVPSKKIWLSEQGVAEVTGDKPFDNMMKGIVKGTKSQAASDLRDKVLTMAKQLGDPLGKERDTLDYIASEMQISTPEVKAILKPTKVQVQKSFDNMFGGGNPSNKLGIRKGVAEGGLDIDDKIKGQIQNITTEISDIPGYWDHQRDTFTPYGVEALEKALGNNKKYVKYALSLTSDDYYVDEGVAEGSNKTPVHSVLLTVTDPNHPMSTKSQTMQRTVSVTGGDREQAIQRAIAHYRKKNYDIHDYHYIGTVDEDVAEGEVDEGWKQNVAAAALAAGNILGTPAQASEPTKPITIAYVTINGETRKYNLGDKFSSVKEAEEFISNILNKKGLSGYSLDIKRGYPAKKTNESISTNESLSENLRKWFKEKWVRFGPDGKIKGDCARGDDSEGKPKCLPQSKAHSLGKKGRASAAARKRKEDPNPERSGKAINVATKKKANEEQIDELKCWTGYHRVKGVPAGAPGSCAKNESVAESSDNRQWSNKDKETFRRNVAGLDDMFGKDDAWTKTKQRQIKHQIKTKPMAGPKGQLPEQQGVAEGHEMCPECGGAMYSEEMINEKKDACYYKVKSRYKVWPSAYASGALVKCRKKGAKNWGNKSK